MYTTISENIEYYDDHTEAFLSDSQGSKSYDFEISTDPPFEVDVDVHVSGSFEGEQSGEFPGASQTFHITSG